MKIRHALGSSALLVSCVLISTKVWSQENTFSNAIASGDVTIALRYRYEFVDQDSYDDSARASTLRLRLNYSTAEWKAWTGFVEFDQVLEAFADDFNSGSGTSGTRRDSYPVVADPDGPDLNQAYLQYSPGEALQARIGRQRILLDDQRFVGGVGWRQNEQTYDGFSLRYDGLDLVDLFYSYVGNVNRIFGREVPAGDHRQNTHLLNAAARLNDDWKVTAYLYAIDNEDAPSFSTRTLGIRASGGIEAGDGKISLLGEYARQVDAANNPAHFDTDYFRIQADWLLDPFSAGLGIESLGSEAGEAFRTPLATLHAFNGWADQFLATPASGLNDRYFKIGYRPRGWNLQLTLHRFSAETGNTDYGSELDVSAGRSLGERYGLLLKLAAFEADAAPYADTTKMWLMLTATY